MRFSVLFAPRRRIIAITLQPVMPPLLQIPSLEIGEIVMKKIKKVNKVAYIRFAAVYRQFEDVDEFKEELKKL